MSEWEEYELKNRLFIGEDGLVHTTKHGPCQAITIKLPLAFILSHRCIECDAAIEYERRWKAYNINKWVLEAKNE